MSSSRAMTNYIECPSDYKCTKLHKEIESVCCPLPESMPESTEKNEERPQSSKCCILFKKKKLMEEIKIFLLL